MAAGQKIKPKDEEASGVTRTKARQNAPKKSAQTEASRTPTSESGSGGAKSGWQQIGEAGASMVQTYKQKQADKDK